MEMIKTYLTLFITILFTSNTFPQNFWEYLGLNGFRVGYITEDNTGRLYASEWQGSGDSVFFSDDGGVNWQSYGEVNDSYYINISSMIALNNNDIILSAWAIQGGGIYKSTDGSLTWQPKNTGLNANDVDKIIKSSDSIYAGATNGVYLSTNDAESWIKLNTEPDTILYVQSIAKSSDGKLFAIDFDNALRSTDNGVTWDTINNGINASQLNSLIISSGKYLLLGTESIGIYKSTDWGDNWELKELVIVRTMTTNSSGYIMAGVDFDGLLLSTDDGESWEQINSGLPSPTWINSVYFDKDGYAYCGVHNFGIYKSTSPVTSVDEVVDVQPKEFKLFQNYPNPFNPSTKIKFTVPVVETGHAPSLQLVVYDILGNKIATLVNEEKPAGSYEAEFDGSNLSSGIYIYKLTAGNFTDSKKLILLK
jgi:photosystem II stability/assembly factor-like uncharacterized protein